MSFRHSIIPGLCAMMLSLAGPAKGAPSSISSIAELRALPHAEASRGVPVHLRGVVALRTASGFYLDDGGVGIWAGFGDPSVLAPEGTEVVIQGVTAGAGYTPFVLVSKLAIVGDVLFQGSIGRTDFPMGNHQDLLDAITGKLWPLGGDTVFVPGHGQPSSFAQERRTNPFVADSVLAKS